MPPLVCHAHGSHALAAFSPLPPPLFRRLSVQDDSQRVWRALVATTPLDAPGPHELRVAINDGCHRAVVTHVDVRAPF